MTTSSSTHPSRITAGRPVASCASDQLVDPFSAVCGCCPVPRIHSLLAVTIDLNDKAVSLLPEAAAIAAAHGLSGRLYFGVEFDTSLATMVFTLDKDPDASLMATGTVANSIVGCLAATGLEIERIESCRRSALFMLEECRLRAAIGQPGPPDPDQFRVGSLPIPPAVAP
jgi:hypothetical protein